MTILIRYSIRLISWYHQTPSPKLSRLLQTRLGGNPRLANKLLHAQQSPVPHVRILMTHQFHRSCFGTQICDDPKRKTQHGREVRKRRREQDALLPLFIMFDILSQIMDSNSQYNWVLTIIKQFYQCPDTKPNNQQRGRGGRRRGYPLELLIIPVIQSRCVLLPEIIRLMDRCPT